MNHIEEVHNPYDGIYYRSTRAVGTGNFEAVIGYGRHEKSIGFYETLNEALQARLDAIAKRVSERPVRFHRSYETRRYAA